MLRRSVPHGSADARVYLRRPNRPLSPAASAPGSFARVYLNSVLSLVIAFAPAASAANATQISSFIDPPKWSFFCDAQKARSANLLAMQTC